MCVTWNANYRKLTTSDQNGLIIVWMLHKVIELLWACGVHFAWGGTSTVSMETVVIGCGSGSVHDGGVLAAGDVV